jgi:hypothetical protein
MRVTRFSLLIRIWMDRRAGGVATTRPEGASRDVRGVPFRTTRRE